VRAASASTGQAVVDEIEVKLPAPVSDRHRHPEAAVSPEVQPLRARRQDQVTVREGWITSRGGRVEHQKTPARALCDTSSDEGGQHLIRSSSREPDDIK